MNECRGFGVTTWLAIDYDASDNSLRPRPGLPYGKPPGVTPGAPSLILLTSAKRTRGRVRLVHQHVPPPVMQVLDCRSPIESGITAQGELAASDCESQKSESKSNR